LHLSEQQIAHLGFVSRFTLHASLIFKTHSHFTVMLVFGKCFVLSLLLGSLFGDHFRGQVVHELLRTALSLGKLSLPVFVLFV
jgi:hypothetical protein